MRLAAMGGASIVGFGDVIFDEDPEAAQALAELYGAGMIDYDGQVQ